MLTPTAKSVMEPAKYATHVAVMILKGMTLIYAQHVKSIVRWMKKIVKTVEPITTKQMKQYFFTFGQIHTHRINGFTFDCDVVCAINAHDGDEARKIMFRNFSDKWSMMYNSCPELIYFPRGVKIIN